MSLNLDNMLSSVAVKFNLRRYILYPHPDTGNSCSGTAAMSVEIAKEIYGADCAVGRCRLTVSKPMLKAPMVSAINA